MLGTYCQSYRMEILIKLREGGNIIVIREISHMKDNLRTTRVCIIIMYASPAGQTGAAGVLCVFKICAFWRFVYSRFGVL